jgi:hypothetical protein
MQAHFRQIARELLHRDLRSLVDSMWGDDWPIDLGVFEIARRPVYDISRAETLTLASELLDKPHLVPQIVPILLMLQEQNSMLWCARRPIPHRLRDRASDNRKVAVYVAAVWLPCMLDADEFDLALDAAEGFLDHRLLDKPFRNIVGGGHRGDGYLGYYYPIVGALGAFIDPNRLDGPKLARVATLLNALVPESGCSYLRATAASIALGLGHKHTVLLAKEVARAKGEKNFLAFFKSVLADRDAPSDHASRGAAMAAS